MEPTSITIRFYEELNDFLPSHQLKQDIAVQFQGRRTVKDLIESLGVPHVEIDLILATGHSVGFDYIVRDQDQISVYPRFEAFDISSVRRLPERPLRQPKFIIDDNVARLCQFMRMLGFDTSYHKGIADASIARISVQEQRIVLSRDKGLLKRREVTHGLYIRSTRPQEQAREVVDRLQLQSLCQPFTRCLLCNQQLLPLPEGEQELRRQIPADVLEWRDEFFLCPVCEKVYWKGSHFEAMNELIRQILGDEA
jgi:uncharacterized protein with PIN domain